MTKIKNPMYLKDSESDSFVRGHVISSLPGFAQILNLHGVESALGHTVCYDHHQQNTMKRTEVRT